MEQSFYVVIFIFYLDGLVIWPRHNFPIIKLDTEYSCIMAPESKESLSNYPSKFKEIFIFILTSGMNSSDQISSIIGSLIYDFTDQTKL